MVFKRSYKKKRFNRKKRRYARKSRIMKTVAGYDSINKQKIIQYFDVQWVP